MSLSVTFYQFSKDRNSTKQPDNVPVAAIYEVSLKEGSPVLSPVLLLDVIHGSPVAWNYCYIPDFLRYYFVDEWLNVRGTLWEVHLSVDVLATYKYNIWSQEQFIERAEQSNDISLFDGLAVGTATVTTGRRSIDSPWRDGTVDYVVEVLGAGESQFYAMTRTQYLRFVQGMFSDEYADSIMAGWADTYPEMKAQLNPLQYIGSVRAYPVAMPTLGQVSGIYVGYGYVPVSAYIVATGGAAAKDDSITFPLHPQSGEMWWLNNAPYSEYELFYPPFGIMPIDAGVIANNSTITTQMRIDVGTGQGLLLVMGGSPTTMLGMMTAQIGVNMAVSQTVVQGAGALSAVSAAGSIISGVLSGNVSAASNAIANIVGNFTPHVRVAGTNAGWAGFTGEISAMGRFQHVRQPDYSRVGKPYYNRATPSALGSGYMKCSGVHLELMGAYAEEIAQCESLMNGGFYYE